MDPTNHRIALSNWQAALYDFDLEALRRAGAELFAPDAIVHLCHPFGSGEGPQFLIDHLAQLQASWPDLERREFIRMAGPTDHDGDWAGCGGYYTGVFLAPWLDIPATGHQVAMRFHEFFKFEDGRVVEFQGIWDIPEVMVQAQAWPMAPQLGKFWQAPGPATGDGLVQQPWNAQGQESKALVEAMLTGLARHDEGGYAAMGLEAYWHPKMNWYGPAGIGTSRGISGFRHWHQIPFLKGMPDRSGTGEPLILFGDHAYVGVTGWPNMRMKLTGDGFMGLVPTGQEITMRSLDFWRCENGLIRENWVLVDLLHVYDQLGVDVFERMRERVPVPLNRGALPG